MFLLLSFARSLSDSDPLITQELVDSINNNPKSTYRAFLNPKFAKMTIGDAKRFLSPIRPIPNNHGSAVPVGANENFMHNVDKRYITGVTNLNIPAETTTDSKKAAKRNLYAGPNQVYLHKNSDDNDATSDTAADNAASNAFDHIIFPVFDVTKLCSSWAPAVTSAMTISVSRWNTQFVNFSLQYVLDCDILGDACIERTPLNAYQLFWTYHPPTYDSWDTPLDNEQSERRNPTDPPRSDFTRKNCENDNCYPGKTCKHQWALTGSCNPGDAETACPIYFLYNWRWIKSHLWEVGAVTSSIVVHPSLFSYDPTSTSGGAISVYSSTNAEDTAIGMLDVTIIGWGQTKVNLSTDESLYTTSKQRWWYVIPHFGKFLEGKNVFGNDFTEGGSGSTGNTVSNLNEGNWLMDTNGLLTDKGDKLGECIMRFNRRFDDCNIESHAVGAVPFNFVPHPYRTPEETYEDY